MTMWHLCHCFFMANLVVGRDGDWTIVCFSCPNCFDCFAEMIIFLILFRNSWKCEQSSHESIWETNTHLHTCVLPSNIIIIITVMGDGTPWRIHQKTSFIFTILFDVSTSTEGHDHKMFYLKYIKHSISKRLQKTMKRIWVNYGVNKCRGTLVTLLFKIGLSLLTKMLSLTWSR